MLPTACASRGLLPHRACGKSSDPWFLLLEWTPVAFAYPHVEPCREDVAAIKPVPYRPFKWGEYQYVSSGCVCIAMA